MNLLEKLEKFIKSKISWGILLGTGISLELCALFFQHVMNLNPCVLCIYQRCAILGIICASIIAMISTKNIYFRLSAYGLWLFSSIKGLLLAIEQYGIQNAANNIFASCSISEINFPIIQLDKYIPFMFNPTGSCGDISWSMFGITMTEYLIFGFVVYILFCFIFLLIDLFIQFKNK